jgi:NDP-sugar pyrophosphorylase family protein
MTAEPPRIAMVLAAGRGLRMRPLSDAVPKPALPLAGGPVVASAVRLAAAAGVRRIVVNCWHLADHMRRAIGEVTLPGIDLELSPERELMGTAGGLALARDRGLLDDRGPVLVINGDGLLDSTLQPMLDRHASDEDLVTLGLMPHPNPSRWSRVCLGSGGLVTGILAPGIPRSGERPFVYPGSMVVSRQSLDAIPATPCETPDRIWWPALAEGRLGGAVVAGDWREIGTPEDYLSAVLHVLGAGKVVDLTAEVARSARLRAAYVGRHSRIHEDTEITESVVAEGAAVREGARVVRSVLLGAVEASVGETIIGEMRASPSC